jgi:hypothetical protein
VHGLQIERLPALIIAAVTGIVSSSSALSR